MNGSRKELENMLAQFCKMAGLKTGYDVTFNEDIRTWSEEFLDLDYNAAYGGYKLEWVEVYIKMLDLAYSGRLPYAQMKAYLHGMITGYTLAGSQMGWDGMPSLNAKGDKNERQS